MGAGDVSRGLQDAGYPQKGVLNSGDGVPGVWAWRVRVGISMAKATKCSPAKVSGRPDDFRDNALHGSCGGDLLARVALISESGLHVLAGGFLDGGEELTHMGTLVLVGGGNMSDQEVAQRVHGQMHLGSLPLRGLLVAPGHQTQGHSQVGGDGFKDACCQPALRLLVDNLPGGQSPWTKATRGALARTIQRSASKTARRLCSRCGA